ncbi:hypothetical protein GCM10022265_03670 [Marinobacter xestospongiae]
MCPEDGYRLNIERLGPELSRHGDGSTSLRNLLAAYEKSGLEFNISVADVGSISVLSFILTLHIGWLKPEFSI